MKFLIDQDVYVVTIRFLRELGHDVVLASELGMSRVDDDVLLHTAHEQERIFVTRDRDYGNLVFVKAFGAGVIYLRILPALATVVHRELKTILESYTADELKKSFVTIDVNGHRIRRIAE
jgi:predicted nuclease of predicted toxin-antitoxin system